MAVVDRRERAERDAAVFVDLHKRVAEIDELDQYGDVLDHLARRARLLRDQARLLTAESRR